MSAQAVAEMGFANASLAAHDHDHGLALALAYAPPAFAQQRLFRLAANEGLETGGAP